MVVTLGSPAGESARVADARSRARERLRRQRGLLRPLGLVVIAVVAVGAVNGHPALSLHGEGLAVAGGLCAFAALLAISIRDRFVAADQATQAAVVSGLGATGVALAALQPQGASGLAGGAAVWMAVARLREPAGIAIGVAITAAVTLAAVLAGGSASSAVAVALLSALLGSVAYFLKESRESQETMELLLAQLEDARERELEAAAVTERGRIAGELHDVLAHSLSGAAIQLQGARKLAERAEASEDVRAAIDRAGELVRDGLASARQAVGALRGDELPGVAQLESLVASFRSDTNADVTLTIDGNARALAADVSLALYRGAQEALTNVARYAPGAATRVVLRYGNGRTQLTVENRLGNGTSEGGLRGVGGGRGLAGLRERVERAGGTLEAGPMPTGWRVELDVPG